MRFKIIIASLISAISLAVKIENQGCSAKPDIKDQCCLEGVCLFPGTELTDKDIESEKPTSTSSDSNDSSVPSNGEQGTPTKLVDSGSYMSDYY